MMKYDDENVTRRFHNTKDLVESLTYMRVNKDVSKHITHCLSMKKFHSVFDRL